ncbi:MAG: hypothetical protein HY828_18350 [Actinobacteria bacterium]|nr:hypothetical protein [Actinomycetota bacterium]
MGKRWTSSKELNELIDKVVEQGWEVVEGKHLKLVPADKTMPIVVVPKTPSDHRGVMNARSQIRRSGGIV